MDVLSSRLYPEGRELDEPDYPLLALVTATRQM
jgi:hypothetical protein